MSIAWISWMLICFFFIFLVYKIGGTIKAVWLASWQKEKALYLERKRLEQEGK